MQALKASYRQRLSELRSAEDTLSYENRETERQKRLLASGISSQSQVDRVLHAQAGAVQAVAAVRQEIENAVAGLGGDPDIDPDRHPTVIQARAELDRATLNLSYTTITAPDRGVVTQVESLQVGDYVNAANPVFALIATHDMWVEANFKEVQLTHMKPRQTATVKIDKTPPIECRQPRYCMFSSSQALAVLRQLKVGSLILIDVFTDRGAFNFSLTPKGYQAGIAQIRAWGYPTE